jgi:hypothetical protein
MGILIRIGSLKLGTSRGASVPHNIVFTIISGGIRITFTPVANTETEIYVDIDGAGYNLIATTGLNIGTYDYTCDDGHVYTFKLRSKSDTTVLNVPANIAVEAITGGARVTWDDNNTEAEHIELWANISDAGYVLLTTLNPGVETYDHTIESGNIYYKIRAKEGTLPIYSSYTSEVYIEVGDPIEALLSDGNTFGWYKADESSTITKDGSNYMSKWADFLAAGNDLNGTGTSKPIADGVSVLFDGSDDRIATGAKTWNQPALILMVVKEVSYRQHDTYLSGGVGGDNCMVRSNYGSYLIIYAGNLVTALPTPVTTYHIIEICYNGANGYSAIDGGGKNPIGSGDFGTLPMQGLMIGDDVTNNGRNANIDVKEIIARKTVFNDTDRATIIAYLKTKYSIT